MDRPLARLPDGTEAKCRETFAVMDYDHPSRSKASGNIGEHVQTLASLGHLVGTRISTTRVRPSSLTS